MLRGVEHLPKIPKEFKGNQREIKGNQRKFLKFSILRFGKCLKNVQAYLKFRKLLFFNQIFFESRRKDLIYPFLTFWASSEHFKVRESSGNHFFVGSELTALTAPRSGGALTCSLGTGRSYKVMVTGARTTFFYGSCKIIIYLTIPEIDVKISLFQII